MPPVGEIETAEVDAAEAISRVAPAKINLALHITGQRADGFHLLESLCVFTRSGDVVTVEPVNTDAFHVEGPFADQLKDDGSNLVVKARDLLRHCFPGQATKPVLIKLEKNLPVASGIGGGSSDAAAALLLLSEYWSLSAGPAVLAEIGLNIGADVPMCLVGKPLIARGIGDEIEQLLHFPGFWLVLVNPGVAVSTADVFRNLQSRQNASLPSLEESPPPNRLIKWLNENRNDLMVPAAQLAPEIEVSIALLNQAGARFARMTGSGATCFGLFDNEAGARSAAADIAKAEPQWFVSAVETGASAP